MTTLDYNKENMDTLAEQLRLGCERTRQRMIEGYMPLVHSKVNKWINIYPSLEYLEEEMVSEGYLAVVTAVVSIERGNKPANSNVTAYVSVAIVNAIGKFLDENSTMIRIPKCSDASPPVIEQIFDRPQRESDPTAMLEVSDLLTAACVSDEDRAIVDLLSKGYTEREVSAQLDIPQSTVNILRYEIHERYNRLERSGHDLP